MVVIQRRPRSMTTNPASLDEVRALIGRYCDFQWLDHNGEEGGMAGTLEKVEQDDSGQWWAVVDYGYGAAVGHFTTHETTDPDGCSGGTAVNTVDA
jgi:hypothetical protein